MEFRQEQLVLHTQTVSYMTLYIRKHEIDSLVQSLFSALQSTVEIW